jgi:hypothetical protein
MSDAALERKFLGNAGGALGEARARAIADRVWSLDQVADVRELVGLCL